METALEPQATLPWLVRLRWIAATGQAGLIALGHWVFGMQLAWYWLFPLVLAVVVSNALLGAWVRQNPKSSRADRVVGGILVLDTLLLTCMLALSGGAMNPFSVFFIVQVVVAAVVLGRHWVTAVALLCVCCFGALFLLPEDGQAGHMHHMQHHLQGMWVAFTLAALLVAYFVRRITSTIALQRRQIAELRDRAARNARLASLTTLAAGAAHELGTPLGTIAVAAHEMKLALSRLRDAGELSEDAQLIALEVERCQAILGKMSARASATDVESERTFAVDDIDRALLERLEEPEKKRVRVRREFASKVRLSFEPLLQTLTALVRNALDASSDGKQVDVVLQDKGGNLLIEVLDQGSGMDPVTLAKAGEPFFTTKEPGRGLGLGLFLARTYAESLGGSLEVDSALGRGTKATLQLPLARVSA